MKRSRKSFADASPKASGKKLKNEPLQYQTSVVTPTNKDKAPSISVKTSGGISKSLLTPCRRLGLARNRAKPLKVFTDDKVSINAVDIENEKPRDKKQKVESSEKSQVKNNDVSDNDSITHNSKTKVEMKKSSKSIEKKISKTEQDCGNSKSESSQESQKSFKGDLENVDVNNVLTSSCDSPKSGSVKQKKVPKIVLNKIKSDSSDTWTATKINTRQSVESLENNCDLESTEQEQSIATVEKDSRESLSIKEDTTSDGASLATEENNDFKKTNNKPSLAESQINNKAKAFSKIKSDGFLIKTSKEDCRTSKSATNISSSALSSGEGSTQSSMYSYHSDDDFEDKTIIEKKTYDKSKKSKLQMNNSKRIEKLIADIDAVSERIKRKEEKLKMINESPKKGLSTNELEELITAWRGSCQKALEELLEVSKEKGSLKKDAVMEDLLRLTNIPHDLVKYDPDEMIFE